MALASNPNVVLITGATAGIGQAAARRFAKAHSRTLILTGRRAERLAALKEELQGTVQEVVTLCFDVRDAEAAAAAWASLSPSQQQVDLLINNAGLARGKGPIHEGLLSDWEEMIDANLKGLLYLTRLVSPGMVQRGQGHIINIGSIAGKEAYPGGNVYNATKHGVDGLTRAMRMDLAPHGIRVAALHPGLVNTEFSTVRFHGDANKADATYKGMIPLSGEDVAEVLHYMAHAPAHVNLADILLLPTDQASATQVRRQ